MKDYADHRTGAKESSISTGDMVLVKQKRNNKLSTGFRTEPMLVVGRKGATLIIEARDGKY